MGRKRKNRNNNKGGGGGGQHQQGRKKKKQRTGQYWVEDCVEFEPPPEEDEKIKTTMTITITRIELNDNHTHHRREQQQQQQKQKQRTVDNKKVDVVNNEDDEDSNSKNKTPTEGKVATKEEDDDNKEVVESNSNEETVKSKENLEEITDESKKISEEEKEKKKKNGDNGMFANHEEDFSSSTFSDKQDNTIMSNITSTARATNTTTTTSSSNLSSSRCKPLTDDEIFNNAFIVIRRDKSARGTIWTKNKRKKKKQNSVNNFIPLANGNCGDDIKNPNNNEIPDKYWAQRKRFFSKFDDGIKLDKEGWYSVTPEVIAQHIANRISFAATTPPDEKKMMTILDPFCGCGGNVIAFAQQHDCVKVIAVDTDKKRLELAANNASIYNIPKEKIIFIHGNACDVLRAYSKKDDDNTSKKKVDDDDSTIIADKKKNCSVTNKNEEDEVTRTIHGYSIISDLALLPDQKIDAIFLSPPWGGMDYENNGKRNYHIETCIEILDPSGGKDKNNNENDNDDDNNNNNKWNGKQILQASAKATNGPVIFFLPRNINGLSLGQNALSSGFMSMELEQNVLNDKLKTVTAYFGM